MAGTCCGGSTGCGCRVNDRYKVSYDPLRDLTPQCTCTWVCKEKMEGTFGTPRSNINQPRPASSTGSRSSGGCCGGLVALVILAVIMVIVISIVIALHTPAPSSPS